jgi:chemotaxis protein CheD
MSDGVVEVGMGSLFMSAAPTVLTTGGIGSCVAVCLFHAATKQGGMAHVMLPNRTQTDGELTEADLRYADAAIAVMMQRFIDQGVNPAHVVAKLAGGASMFPDVQGRSVRVGEKNVEAIKAQLEVVGTRVVAEDIGGSVGRAVSFDLSNGIVQVRTSL